MSQHELKFGNVFTSFTWRCINKILGRDRCLYKSKQNKLLAGLGIECDYKDRKSSTSICI